MTSDNSQTRSVILMLLITVQALCAVFFLVDVARDFIDNGGLFWSDMHLAIEALAAVVLALGVVVEVQYLMHLLRRQARMQRGLNIASGALNEMIDGYFAAWGLTSAEQDVALFTLKGYSIAEVARLRGSAEGTVKAHLNAIYRKAGVNGRGALVSLVIEDLMNTSLLDGKNAPPESARAG